LVYGDGLKMAMKELSGWAVGLIVAFLTVGFGALILSETADAMSGNATAVSIVNTTAIGALADMANLFAPLAIVVVAAVIIGVLFTAFGNQRGWNHGMGATPSFFFNYNYLTFYFSNLLLLNVYIFWP